MLNIFLIDFYFYFGTEPGIEHEAAKVRGDRLTSCTSSLQKCEWQFRLYR